MFRADHDKSGFQRPRRTEGMTEDSLDAGTEDATPVPSRQTKAQLERATMWRFGHPKDKIVSIKLCPVTAKVQNIRTFQRQNFYLLPMETMRRFRPLLLRRLNVA
jgi:hypothetical protein